MTDPYDDQLAAARYRAERDQARQELARLKDRSRDTTVSAYDLLPEEDREILRWVRGHGGLDEVRRDFQDAYNRRSELCAALGIDLDTGWSDAMAELDRRLMPEGMEWPMYESGEPVRIGDEVCSGGRPFIVNHVVLFSNGESTVCAKADMDSGKPRDYARVRHGYRLKRPAPKVLDADGAEIRVGEMVYSTENGDEFTVMAVSAGSGEVHVRWGYDFEDKTGTIAAKLLTHRAPVLAADGKPLRDGETVWSVKDGTEYKVGEIRDTTDDDDEPCKIIGCSNDELHIYCAYFPPDKLTHERPESKCRDCAHWQKDPTADNMGVCWFFYHEYEGEDCYAARRADIGACEEFVRRAKALAERERGE